MTAGIERQSRKTGVVRASPVPDRETHPGDPGWAPAWGRPGGSMLRPRRPRPPGDRGPPRPVTSAGSAGAVEPDAGSGTFGGGVVGRCNAIPVAVATEEAGGSSGSGGGRGRGRPPGAPSGGIANECPCSSPRDSAAALPGGSPRGGGRRPRLGGPSRGFEAGPMSEESLFAAALEVELAADREAFLDEACAGDLALRRAGRPPARGPREGLRHPRHAGHGAGVRPRPPGRASTGASPERGHGPPGRRPLPAARGDRRGGHGHGLAGRADAAGPPQGGREARPGGDGLEVRPGALRGRAAGPGPDGPPQHRQGPRRRHHRGRPALLRDGVRRGPPHHAALRRRPPEHPRAPRACSCRSARPSSTPTPRGSSTAT